MAKWLTARSSDSERDFQSGFKGKTTSRKKEKDGLWERETGRKRAGERDGVKHYDWWEQPSPSAAITGRGKQLVTYFLLILYGNKTSSTRQHRMHDSETCVHPCSYFPLRISFWGWLKVVTSRWTSALTGRFPRRTGRRQPGVVKCQKQWNISLVSWVSERF